jgi:hypothetical protein
MPPDGFFGWRVMWGAFVLAVFGWGIGFYGPPIFLHALVDRGWPVTLASAAVTVHFLAGALVVANLSALYGRFGLPAITKAAVVVEGLGVCGWALAQTPWQLFAAALLSGAGWVAMSAAAINAILTPWFERQRPMALATAYNGASVGGVVFSPLWVAAIAYLGFERAALLVAVVAAAVVWWLATSLFSKTPAKMGLCPDGVIETEVGAPATKACTVQALPKSLLWQDTRFITLSAAMAIGLFAQIGLLAHLFSILVPGLGVQFAGWALGAATGAAIVGRMLGSWMIAIGIERRLVAFGSYGAQVTASLLLLLSGGGHVPLLLIGTLLFGSGIGNATSLPPLIAQAEFNPVDVARVVPLIVAISQAGFAFAPLAFGVIRELPSLGSAGVPALFVAAATLQGAAAICLLAGRR